MEYSFFAVVASSSIINWMVLLSALAYVYLAAKGDIWCWSAGFLTAFLSCFIFIVNYDASQLFLNCYYLFIAIYGWNKWLEPARKDERSVYVHWSVTAHAYCVAIIVFISAVFISAVPNWFEPKNVFLGAVLTAISFVASVLTAHRVIASWIYWLIANVLAVALYWEGYVNTTVTVFSLYSILSVYGYVQWTKLRNADI